MPLFAELGLAPAPGPGEYDKRHSNCSGKHAGFLAFCVQQGWPIGDYLAPGHALQQAIRRDVSRAVGLAPEDLKIGIDGCSAPNYAMPLARLARNYARLASGSSDEEFGESFSALALDAQQREELRPWRAQAIVSARGTQVGERKPTFTLRFA